MTRLYVLEVETHRGRRLVGPWYLDKAAAKSWVPFVRKFYYGAKTRVRTFTREQAVKIQANGGQL